MRHRRIQKSDRHKKFKTILEPKEVHYVKNYIKQQSNQNSIPRKLKEILEIKNQSYKKINKKNRSQNGEFYIKPSEKFEIQPGMTRAPKTLPEMVFKGSHESKHHFICRLNRMVAQSMAEANLEEHFDVDLGPTIPNQKIPKRNKPEVLDPDEETKKKRKREKNRKNLLRRKANKLRKKHRLKKQLDHKDDSPRKDQVNLGELVHCPPSFNFKKSKKH